jgi:hypothetical protein
VLLFATHPLFPSNFFPFTFPHIHTKRLSHFLEKTSIQTFARRLVTDELACSGPSRDGLKTITALIKLLPSLATGLTSQLITIVVSLLIDGLQQVFSHSLHFECDIN